MKPKIKITVAVEGTENFTQEQLTMFAQQAMDAAFPQVEDAATGVNSNTEVTGFCMVRHLDIYGATADCNCKDCQRQRRSMARLMN